MLIFAMQKIHELVQFKMEAVFSCWRFGIDGLVKKGSLNFKLGMLFHYVYVKFVLCILI